MKKAWAMILQPILHRKPVRGGLLLCNRYRYKPWIKNLGLVIFSANSAASNLDINLGF